ATEILAELSRAHEDAAEYGGDLAASHVELGEVYRLTGRLDKAEAAHLQALEIQERLAAGHKEVTEYRRALARTRTALGRLYLYSMCQYEKAQDSLEQSLAIWSELVENDAHAPENRHGLANAQRSLGMTYKERGQSDKAEVTLRGAVATAQALARDYPDVVEYR